MSGRSLPWMALIDISNSSLGVLYLDIPMTEDKRDADSMVSGVTLLTIKGLLELIDADDAGVSLRVGGLGKTYGLKLLAFKDSTQY